MKTKVVEKEIYKTILDKKVEETIYITEDGKEFTNPQEAQEYESTLTELKRFKKIPSVYSELDVNIEYLNDMWYYLRTIEDVKIFVSHHGGYKQRHYTTFLNEGSLKKFDEENDKLLHGNWASYYEDSSGDNYWTRGFYTLDYIKNKFDKFLRAFEGQE